MQLSLKAPDAGRLISLPASGAMLSALRCAGDCEKEEEGRLIYSQ